MGKQQSVALLSENEVEKRYLAQIDRRKKRRRRRRLIKIIGLVVICFLIFSYLNSDLSKFKSITVVSNRIYTDDQILEAANVGYDDSYLLSSKWLMEKDIKELPFVEDVLIHKDMFGSLTIEVVESKIIGYLSSSNHQFLIQGKGVVSVENLSPLFYAAIPRIGNFTDEQLEQLDKAFENVDPSLIEFISEIEPYSTSYDENMVQFVMIDGNRVSSSMKGIELINNYRSVLKDLKGTHVCLYMEDITGTIFSENIDCRIGLKDYSPTDEQNDEEISDENGEEVQFENE